MLDKNQIIQDLYTAIEPAVWITNFKDGSTETSKKHESFNDISFERKKDIVSFQLKVDDNRFIINRKRDDGSLIDGFFYHIKEGRTTLQGNYQGINIEFYAERIGFCYNSNGDSIAIRISHSNFVNKIGKRMRDKIEPILYNEIAVENKEDEIDKLINEPIKYSIQSDFYHENVIDKKINIALFGQLEKLEEMGTAPRSYMNNEEIAIHAGIKN